MNKLTLSNIAQVLVGKNGMGQKEATAFAAALFDVIRERLEEEGLVKVKGLGTFKRTAVEPRESINVRTGERVLIDSHEKISFTPDSVMKELVNKPFSQFETVTLNDDVDFTDLKNDAPAKVQEDHPTEQVLETEVPETEEEPEMEEVPETEEEPDSHWLRNIGLVVLVLALMAASAAGGYLYGTGRIFVEDTPPDTSRVVQSVPVKVEPSAKDTVLNDTLTKDTVRSEQSAPMPETKDSLDRYAAMDARVRLGAYRIVGLDREVKAREGDNLWRIAKREFGSEDMVCYLEVFNGLGGQATLEKGQVIRIPALKWKKKKRQNQ